MLQQKPTNPLLRRAVHLALSASVALPLSPAIGQEQDAAAADIGTVTVTGSRIRRVDAETASPVYTLGTDVIHDSGVTTMGKLVQEVPSIAGAATNPQVNNGGGTGASHVELRGLDTERTLVLLNGRRIGALTYEDGAVDINVIPVNMIERVEILKEGAGAIYGSDAVAGVVNFITKKNYEGADVSLDYGVSAESDGERQSIGLTWGTVSDHGSFMLGANWNKQEEISAADREFARNAIYFYGSVFVGGSSRTPTGRIDVATPGCTSGSVTRVDGSSGASPADYRCFISQGDASDRYNFQPLNLVMTPQERGSIFASGNYQLGEGIETYAEYLHNYTTANWQIAALPFDSRNDDVVISAQNIYNPFGIDFGGLTTGNPNAQWRMIPLGERTASNDSSTDQVNIGMRGDFGGTSWTWDGTLGYGRIDQDRKVSGYLFQPALANAFGPSFIDGNGTPTCGTPTAPISGCIPVNIFNLGDASQVAALNSISGAYSQNFKYTTETAQLSATGDVFDLPAGAAQLAVGAEYREQTGRWDTDFLTQAQPPLFTNCLLAQETCSGDSRGTYDVKELYAELFVPLLEDVPLAQELNVTLGARYSDYSTFGDTTNGVFKVEYRPFSDLLVRASYSEIFRSPTIFDMFGAPSANAPTFTDPCVGLTSAELAANPNLSLACQNVVPDTGFTQDNSQITGLILGNPDLDPETGDVITYGFVYEPGYVKGLSLTVDVWDYKIDDVITAVDVNTTATGCVNSGDPLFCNLITRFGDGQVQVIQQPTLNLGTLETNGIDFGVQYLLSGTGAGDFRFRVDTTYIDSYENTLPVAGVDPIEVVGTYDRQYGNYAQWRAILGIGWAYQGFNALVKTRYVDSIHLNDPDAAPGIQPELNVPSATYVDLTLGYMFKESLEFQVGGENLGDEQPPILYQNNVINANTDVQTYDTVGRFYWARLSYNFK
jgi:outer membrane receptor protein involved in Fe transport